MNNPYPSSRHLLAETLADELLADQATATAAFQLAVQAFSAAVAKLHFPLGSPAAGYDLDDITGSIGDWLTPDNDALMNHLADEEARSMLEEV